MKHAKIIKVKDGYYLKIEKGYTCSDLREAKAIAKENGCEL